jgi:hypothetical protein
MKIEATTKLLTTGNRLMSLTQQLCKVPCQDCIPSVYLTLEVDPIVRFSEMMKRGEAIAHAPAEQNAASPKGTEIERDKEIVLSSDANFPQKSARIFSSIHRKTLYRSEEQKRAKPDRQLLDISPAIARVFQTMNKLNLSSAMKIKEEGEKITSFPSHQHLLEQETGVRKTFGSRLRVQESEVGSWEKDRLVTDSNPPPIKNHQINNLMGDLNSTESKPVSQKHSVFPNSDSFFDNPSLAQVTSNNDSTSSPQSDRVSPKRLSQGMRLRQSSAGIAGILKANLKTPDLSQEVTQTNDEEEQRQAEQFPSNAFVSSPTASSSRVPLSEESKTEQIITELTQKLEFEYLRTYGNLPGEPL